MNQSVEFEEEQLGFKENVEGHSVVVTNEAFDKITSAKSGESVYVDLLINMKEAVIKAKITPEFKVALVECTEVTYKEETDQKIFEGIAELMITQLESIGIDGLIQK